MKRAIFAIDQPTKSFPEGAPQREEYNSDEYHDAACVRYDREWRQEYHCPGCHQVECPNCGRASKGVSE